MSFDGCDTNDLDFDNVAVLYHDVCVESQERPPVVSTSKVQWPTSLALLLVEACVEYCKNHNILLLNFDDSAIDWYAMVATIKWPEARHKTVHECVKKLKYIRNLWKSRCGNLSQSIRVILRQTPQIFGPERTGERRRLGESRTVDFDETCLERQVHNQDMDEEAVWQEDRSCKRPLSPTPELDSLQTEPKRYKLDEIVQLLEYESRECRSGLELSQQRLIHLRQQFTQLQSQIKTMEDGIKIKTARYNRIRTILDATRNGTM